MLALTCQNCELADWEIMLLVSSCIVWDSSTPQNIPVPFWCDSDSNWPENKDVEVGEEGDTKKGNVV